MSQDFSKAKIYKITNDFNDDVYVGSTCDELTKRFSKHKYDSYDPSKQNRPFYKLVNEIGFNRFRIELIENYPCEDIYQLRQREGHHIREMGTLNVRIENRTQKEYMDNYNKTYYQENKEYHQNLYKMNSETLEVKRNENKKEKKAYDKNYREKNKETISQQEKERKAKKIFCECGCEVRYGFLHGHKKTQKHINLMKEKEEK